MTELLHEDLTYEVRGACFEVYKELGNGHKEKVYHKALSRELQDRGVDFDSEARINITYKDEKVGTYVPDFLVEDKVILEIKAKEAFHKSDIQQFWNYLRGSDYKLGLLVNFGAKDEVEIVRRVC